MKNETLKLPRDFWYRALLFATGSLILILVYVFQRSNPAALLGDFHPNVIFATNRTLRLILNDLACLLIIYAVFRGRNYLRIAFFVFLIELFVVLPGYLAIKLWTEGASELSSPLLSQVHRLIVNPMLMILLILGFFYQNLMKRAR